MNGISVIIPLFNKEKQIDNTLKSVLSQSYEYWECVVIDDGSSDYSGSIVNSIKDSRIKYIKKENGGPSSARNLGIKNASYDWVLFLDADDRLLPEALEHFNQLIEDYNGILCFVGNMYIQRNKRLIRYSYVYKNGIIRNNFLSVVLNQCRMRAGTTVFYKGIFDRFKFNNSLWRYEDAELTYKVMREYKVCLSNKPVYIYNQDSLSASYKRKNIKEDYLGHLRFCNNLFYNIMIYGLYVQACKMYPDECKTLYSGLEIQKTIIWAYKLLRNKYFQIIYKYCFPFKYIL